MLTVFNNILHVLNIFECLQKLMQLDFQIIRNAPNQSLVVVKFGSTLL